MAWPLIDDRLANELVSALGSTLLYSLWQGVLLAMAAGLIIVCTRKRSATLRYNLLLLAMVLFAGGVPVTFITMLHGSEQITGFAVMHITTLQSAPIASQLQPVAHATFADVIKAYINSHYTTIVLVWFLIICAKSIRMAVGLQGTYRLKYTSVLPVDDIWQARLQQLSTALGIRRGVRLLQSGLAKVPLAIGHLKPVILLPVGMLTSLAPAEIEAILLHELAHIRRSDYLVNLLQNLMEILFFFNPAVLWVSQLLKTERENCCDDLALTAGNSKANYIRALVSCEEYKPVKPAHAMAFANTKHSLLNRVKRMAGNRNHSLSPAEKTALAVCLVISGFCVMAFTKKQPVKQPARHTANALQDTVPGKTATQANTGTATLQNFADSTFYPPTYGSGPEGTVLFEKWSKQDAAANRHVIADLLRDGIITDANNVSLKLSGTSLIVNGKQQSERLFKKYEQKYVPPVNRGTDWTWTHVVINKPKPDTTVHAQNGLSADSSIAKTKQNIIKAAGLMQSQAPSPKTYNEQAAAYNPPPKNYDASAAMYDSAARNYVFNQPRVRDQAIQAKRDKAILAEILTDMMHDNIITQKDNIDFKLTGQEFIVNGVKQNGAIFKRYMDKYVPPNDKTNWTWTHANHYP